MQSSSVTLTCGSHVLFYTPAYVIRGMVNSMSITLLNDAGTALDITDVSTWALGITEDFFGETGVLAGSSTITAAENVLAVTMNGHTEELASLMNGKKSIQAYATLRGRDASDVINRLYVFPVVILNIGFTNDTILTTAAQELTYTKAQIDYLLSQLPGGTGAEKIENKTQAIDTEEPSADKYPSEAAAVTYVAGQVSPLNAAISGKVDKEAGKVLSDNNFTTAEKNKLESALTAVPDASTTVKGAIQIATGEEVTTGEDTVKAVVPATLKTELDKKVDKETGKVLSDNNFTTAEKNKLESALTSVPDASESVKGILMLASAAEAAAGLDTGKAIVSATLKTELDKKESTANKAVDFSTVNNVKFPTVQAVKNFAQNETLTELTGTDVTVAPWTQSKWSASGVCSLTASGWAASGHQVAYVLITLADEATLSVSGASVADDDALSAAGTYACYLINENGTVRFKVAGFTEAV